MNKSINLLSMNIYSDSGIVDKIKQRK